MPYPWPFTDERDADMEPGLWDRVHPSWKALEVARSAESQEEARARLLPPFDDPRVVIHFLHRIGALLVATMVVAVAVRPLA